MAAARALGALLGLAAALRAEGVRLRRQQSKTTLSLQAPWRHLVSADGAFGPGGCVRVTKTLGGTCEIATHCTAMVPRADANEGLEHLEFAFFCLHGQRLTKHSYGHGGFETQEKFDSRVSCDSCHAPRLSDYAVSGAVGSVPHAFGRLAAPAAAAPADAAAPAAAQTPLPHPSLVSMVLPSFCPPDPKDPAALAPGASPCCEATGAFLEASRQCEELLDAETRAEGADQSASDAMLARNFCEVAQCRETLDSQLSLVVPFGMDTRADKTGLCTILSEAAGSTRQLFGAVCAPSVAGDLCAEELARSFGEPPSPTAAEDAHKQRQLEKWLTPETSSTTRRPPARKKAAAKESDEDDEDAEEEETASTTQSPSPAAPAPPAPREPEEEEEEKYDETIEMAAGRTKLASGGEPVKIASGSGPIRLSMEKVQKLGAGKVHGVVTHHSRVNRPHQPRVHIHHKRPASSPAKHSWLEESHVRELHRQSWLEDAWLRLRRAVAPYLGLRESRPRGMVLLQRLSRMAAGKARLARIGEMPVDEEDLLHWATPRLCTECATGVTAALIGLAGSGLEVLRLAPEVAPALAEFVHIPVAGAHSRLEALLLAAKELAQGACAKSAKNDFCGSDLVADHGPAAVTFHRSFPAQTMSSDVFSGSALCGGGCGKAKAQVALATAALMSVHEPDAAATPAMHGNPTSAEAAALYETRRQPSSQGSAFLEVAGLTDRSCGRTPSDDYCIDRLLPVLRLGLGDRTGLQDDPDMGWLRRGAQDCAEASAGGVCSDPCSKFVLDLSKRHGCCARDMLVGALWAEKTQTDPTKAFPKDEAAAPAQERLDSAEALARDVRLLCLDEMPKEALRPCVATECERDATMQFFVELPGESWVSAVVDDAVEPAFRAALRRDVAAAVGESLEFALVHEVARSAPGDASVRALMEFVTEDCERNELARRMVETKAKDGLLQLGETSRLLAGLLPQLGGNRSIVSGELVLRKGKLCEGGRCSYAPALLNGVLGGSTGVQHRFEGQFRRVTAKAVSDAGMPVTVDDVSVLKIRVRETGELAVEYEVRLHDEVRERASPEQLRLVLAGEVGKADSQLRKAMDIDAGLSSVQLGSTLRELQPPRLTVDDGFVEVTRLPDEGTLVGPDSCVSIFRSRRGTCMIRTKQCDPQKMKHYRVSFSCPKEESKEERHTFGKGTFRANEVFDSGIQCAVCAPADDFENQPLGGAVGVGAPIFALLVGTVAFAAA